MRRFGQDTGDIVVISQPVKPHVAPGRKDGRIDNAGDAGLLQLIGHVGAIPTDLPPNQGIRVWVDWLTVRGHVQSCPVATHFVVVLENLWLPIEKQGLGHVFRLHQVGHEGVPVVIVPCILMVQPGKWTTFVLGLKMLTVPIGHHNLTVGILTIPFS